MTLKHLLPYQYERLTNKAYELADEASFDHVTLEELMGVVREAWVVLHQDKLRYAKEAAHSNWKKATSGSVVGG